MSAAPFRVGAALTFTEANTGFLTGEQFSSPTVQTSVTSLLNNNADRLELAFWNNSANDVIVFWDSSVSLTNGFRVVANGGFLVIKLRDDFTLVTRPFFGIANTGAVAISITEVVRVTDSHSGGQ